MVERIRAEWLLTDAAAELISDGAVDIDRGKVIWSGPAAEAPERAHAELVETGLDGLVMPGLINAHCHTPMVLLRGAGEGLPLEKWLSEVMWPRESRLTPDDVYWGMTLGAAELLQRGVTTSSEMYFHAPELAQAAIDAGLRSVVAAPLIEGNPAFGTVEDQLADAVAMAGRFADDPQIDVALGPHSVYALSRSALEQVAAAADQTGLLVHIHVAELPAENAMSAERHGMAVVPLLDAVGMLDGPMLAAHGIWLDDRDRQRLARSQTGVAHCPTSNLRHANGMASVVALRRAGIPVALGTDGPASAPRLDLFAEMRLALGLARGSELSAQVMTPRQALAMATSSGAEVLGRDDIGTLRPGSQADLICIDIEPSVFGPTLEPEDLITHLVWGGAPSEVRHVWVGGRQLVRDGQVQSVDLDRASTEVAARAARIAQ